MSEIQGIKSVIKVAENDDDSLVSAIGEISVDCQLPEEENHQETKLHNAQETTSETMRALKDIGKTLDIQQHESLDQTSKRDDVVGRSVGECRNILPVLVEHLRSALELSADSSNRSITNAEPLVLDQLSHCNTQYESESKLPLSFPPTMDFNFFQDLLVFDIKTALVRLQEILHRVNGDALNRYSSTLEPNDKLNLLQLITNLVTNLKKAKIEDSPQQLLPTTNSVSIVEKKKQNAKRRDRHTIGVSSEELARARKWFDERGTGISLISQRFSLTSQTVQLENSSFTQEEKEKAFESSRACDKHMKDAINQQQSLHSKTKDIEINQISSKRESKETKVMNDKIVEKLNKSTVIIEPSTFINKFNKFSAKKYKIKRANTIDIPNCMNLHVQKLESTTPGLRRPIDISDRLFWNTSQVSNIIPSFEPKTENDRKFLALINRNNETNGNIITHQPFKSFNYRQTSSIADKNWKSQFVNIKTTFDKPSSVASTDDESLGTSIKDSGKNFFFRNREKEKVFVLSPRFNKPREASLSPHNKDTYQKLPIFNHAVTSPFQSIQNLQKGINKETKKPLSSIYLPACAGSSGKLKAKMKMFDQESSIKLLSLPQVKSTGRANINGKLDKILKNDESNNCQIKDRTNNFSHNMYDKNRRYTVFNNSDKFNIYNPDVQQRQSVAVQTNNDVIQMNETENDKHNSSIIPQQICSHYSQTHQPLVSKIFNAENNYSTYTSHKLTPRELEFFVDSSMNNKNDKKYWNYDSNNEDHITDDDTSDHSFMDQNIENQDINDNLVITRYTGAIGTMEESPSLSPISAVQYLTPVLSPNCYQDNMSISQPVILHDDIQRHNILQQSLIRHLHHQNDEQKKSNQISTINQKYLNTQCNKEKNFLPIVHSIQSYSDQESYDPSIENRNTQEKIHIFESKLHNINRNKSSPLILSTNQYVSTALPKITVVSPPHIQPLKLTSAQTITPIPKKYSTDPVDSSDEYLVSCANKSDRSIVLSKSESWHQLALSKNHLQVPQSTHSAHKPPRISSQTSKHTEPLSDTFKKIEKVQSYFLNDQKHKESKTCQLFSPKHTQGVLTRSHTMPHIFDDALEVDKAFDNLFEEITRDNRH